MGGHWRRMIIIATPDGVEIDGILLKNTVEVQAYISAHRPQDLEVTMEPIPPHDIVVPIGAHPPVDLLTKVGVHPPKDLSAYFTINWPLDLQIKLGVSRPYDFEAHIGVSTPHRLEVDIGAHSPVDIDVILSPIPYHKLEVYFWSAHYYHLYSEIGIHNPYDLDIWLNILQKHELITHIGVHSPKDLLVFFRLFHSTSTDLTVFVKPVHSSLEDLYVNLWGWGMINLSVPLGVHSPFDLSAHFYGWRYHDLNSAISASTPQDLEVGFTAAPEDGYDLLVIHRTFRTIALLVNFDIWKGVAVLPVTLHGVYYFDFNVEFTMGGRHDFSINLPMTTGYKDLFVTLKPASRVMTTIIPILTMEIHDLYVSINQGWPCGFGSSYKNLSVTFKPAFFLAFEAVFKVIDGSGVSSVGAYVNRSYFTSFFNSYPLEFYLPETTGDVFTNILEQLPVTYENQFDDIVQDIIQLKFSWPRIRIFSGELNFSVDFVAYRQDPYYDLLIELYAIRADVPKMPTSQPIVQRTRPWEEPVWPAVFQVKEIELWADDPPEVTRVIEVVFGEQVHEYYWLSSEQRAYKKEDYERWTMMTRGYLPHAEYSGQIDYVALYEISDMGNYETIDAAFRALISSFSYKGQSKLEVMIKATGSYQNLKVIMDVWGSDRFYNLAVFIEPVHLYDLSVQITCIP
jgi:hypothetical protein